MPNEFEIIEADLNRVDALSSENEQLRDALKNLFGLVSDGSLVRDTSKDDEPDWAIRAMRLTRIIATAQLLSAK